MVESPLNKVQQYVTRAALDGRTLTEYTSSDWRYYLLQDSVIFKIHQEKNHFYQLDLERFVWFMNSPLMSRYYDAAYDVSEIADFRDYFPHEAPKKLGLLERFFK